MAASTERSRILRLALPAVVNNISLTLMQTVDMIFVGGLGPEAIGAVGTIGTLVWAVMTIADGLGTGITAVVARKLGAREWHGARVAAWTGLVATLGLGLVITPFLIVFRSGLLQAIQLPAELWNQADSYLHVFLIFLPAAFFRNALDSAHRASGAAVGPTLITLGANVLNVALDPLLIFGWFDFPPLGTAGAALATGLSTCIAGLVQAIMIGRTPYSPWRSLELSRRLLGSIVDIGLPSFLEQAAMAVSQNLLIAWAVNPLGALPAASFQITMRLSSLSFTPAFGFGMAAIVLVGQSLGARDPALARRLGWRATFYAMGVLGGLSFVYAFFASELVGFFTTDPAVIALSIWPLRVYALTMAFLGGTMVLGPALRGAGDTRFTLWTMLASRFGVRLPVALILCLGADWGLVGVWIGMGADFVLRALLLGWRFHGDRWVKALRV